MLGIKRRCHAVEVACPGVDGERLSDECRVASLLVEVEYAEPVGDEVQSSEEEGLGWLEDRRNPHPSRWECAAMVKMVEKWVIR